MSQSFDKLGIIPQLTAALSKADISTPIGIQAQVIPLALAGKDIIGQSATGTGKTLAYLLPLFQRIDPAKRETQAMVLAPTHELAIQIQRQAEMLAANAGMPVTAAPLIGDVNIMRQIEKLKEKPHIIVGSGGRILELIQKKKINAQTIKTIILDEADRLLDEKNVDNVKAVIKTTLKDRQLMMFSATMGQAALSSAEELMKEPEIITAQGEADAKPDIEHMYFVADQRDKVEVLRKLTHSINFERALVFINKSDDVEMTVAKLNYLGLKAAGIHGSFVKGDRKKALEDFRNAKIQLLIASDVAARGLDIPGVDYVVNLDMPEDPEVYLHRVGRTGRAGRSGTAISIVSRTEAGLIGKCERFLKIAILPKHIERGRVFAMKKG